MIIIREYLKSGYSQNKVLIDFLNSFSEKNISSEVLKTQRNPHEVTVGLI